MNLNGLPIRGTNNYKGFVTIGTDVTEGLTTTLKAVGDGVGVYSPLQLSTTQVAVVNAISGAYKGLSIINTSYTDNGFAALLFENTNVSYNAVSARIASNVGSGGVNPTLEFWTANAAKTITLAGVIDKNQNWVIGTTTASARLHVRGDGTNPIARFENSGGVQFFKVNQSTYATVTVGDDSTANYFTLGLDAGGNANILGNYGSGKTLLIGNGLNYTQYRGTSFDPSGGIYNYIGPTNFTAATTYKGFAVDTSIANGAGASSFHVSSVIYTINNSGAQTGTATGIFLNATEGAVSPTSGLNGMTHNLMDLQTGGVSKFRISVTEATVTTAYNISAAVFLGNAIAVSSSGGVKVGSSRIRSDADGNLTLLNDAANSFSLLKFGGTTNAFPAIKRNSAAIDFVLADDVSGFCDINAKAIVCTSTGLNNGSRNITYDDSYSGLEYQGFGGHTFKVFNGSTYVEVMRVTGNSATPSLVIGASSGSASAILQADSTTQGFLPPRMDDTAVRAITSPAEGLVVFNTTISHFCVYQGGNWVRMSHSPM